MRHLKDNEDCWGYNLPKYLDRVVALLEQLRIIFVKHTVLENTDLTEDEEHLHHLYLKGISIILVIDYVPEGLEILDIAEVVVDYKLHV